LAKEFDVITALDICADLLVECGDTEPEFGQKEKLVNGYSIEMGGSACIFACQCARLGMNTAGAGAAGSDVMGGLVLDSLRDSGVNTSHIRTYASAKTALTISMTKRDGDRAMLTYMGTIDAVKKEWLEELLPKTRHLHICSYYLTKSLQTAYLDLVRQAKRLGVTVSLDTNWDPEERWDGGVREILPYVDIFLPNENEIKYITGEDDFERALRYTGEIVPVTAVKRGERGALACSGGQVWESGALNVAVADAVGAGDSFNGGFVYGFLSGMPIEKCLRAGTICGSLSVRKPGGRAGQPDLREMADYL